jgi:hypothetical protein
MIRAIYERDQVARLTPTRSRDLVEMRAETITSDREIGRGSP